VYSADIIGTHGWTDLHAGHQFYQKDGQSKSHFSLVSVTPAIRKLRVLSRLGLSYLSFKTSQDEPEFVGDDNSATSVRQSRLQKSPLNGRLEMSRKISVRAQGISHPMPLITRPERPSMQRGESLDELLPNKF
jgi:hypothetical protein